MTTWLPAVCLVWTALCGVVASTDPTFSRGRDYAVGAVVGVLFGGATSVAAYIVIRLAALVVSG
ncbi:hypothetical protein [Halomonas sp. NO4]|uniref:hypothetical protein n=1 Tax=Halomonas sp. NO4 TaxID=2484813 RepID=UPI0013CFC20E|nr:hypothetical protein [Halomonas sp. NO4]